MFLMMVGKEVDGELGMKKLLNIFFFNVDFDSHVAVVDLWGW